MTSYRLERVTSKFLRTIHRLQLLTGISTPILDSGSTTIKKQKQINKYNNNNNKNLFLILSFSFLFVVTVSMFMTLAASTSLSVVSFCVPSGRVAE